MILIALTIHELAHGWSALRLGDTTAKKAGRLSFNPISHLDPLGTLMLVFAPFGWAKPVPVNMYNLSNPKRDIVFISAAGPLSNIILALLFGYLIRTASMFGLSVAENAYVAQFFTLAIQINLGIAFFNLLPVPPLDGSKIVMGLLPQTLIPGYVSISRFLPVLFLVMIMAEWLIPGVNIFTRVLYPLFKPFYLFWISLILI